MIGGSKGEAVENLAVGAKSSNHTETRAECTAVSTGSEVPLTPCLIGEIGNLDKALIDIDN